MKAIITTKYGSPEVLQLTEIEIPSPKKDEVLIKIISTTVTAADTMMRKGSPYLGRLYLGLRKPKRAIPGVEFSGVVVNVGDEVNLFKPGEAVFGETLNMGCNAEYVCVHHEDVLITKPDNISHEEASPVSGSGITVLNFLKSLGDIQKGHKVLINGASGALGTYAVQIAKHYGADVTGVCSTPNVEMVKSLGADKVIDYTLNDFTNNKDTYDIIFDTVGKSSYSQSKGALTANGVYLSPVLNLRLLLQMMWTSKFSRKKARFSATGMLPAAERLIFLKELRRLFISGKVRSIIDRKYPLEEIVEAHRYVDTGRKRGNVVISIA